MELHVHNTLTGRKERFEPADPKRVTMYVCGPTVYDLVHIGNGRPAVVFDVLFRFLRLGFPEVAYVRNITDIEDKINAAAKARREPIAALSERFIEEYERDVAALGCLTPTLEPRATGHIAEIIDMIAGLIDAGHAYAAEGHVLFDVPSDPRYGRLSRRSLEDMLDGARVEVAPYKRDAKDFVLWKPSSDDLPGWDSPWGRGRPGWHIECSAMIRAHLGATIDIHGGGSDLMFPHHENELAQSTGDGAEFVRYWMHNGMLTLGAEKMAKSVGNIVTIRELLGRYRGEVLRYALLSGHYRSPLAFSEEALHQAKASLDRLYGALRKRDDNGETSAAFADMDLAALPAAVRDALADDLNTPQALAAMHAIAGNINRSDDPSAVRALREELLAASWVLGLLGERPDDYFRPLRAKLDDAAIEARIEARNAARRQKDYARADEIRDELEALGIELEDTREGTRWKAT